jgi:hypothetical protein
MLVQKKKKKKKKARDIIHSPNYHISYIPQVGASLSPVPPELQHSPPPELASEY